MKKRCVHILFFFVFVLGGVALVTVAHAQDNLPGQARPQGFQDFLAEQGIGQGREGQGRPDGEGRPRQETGLPEAEGLPELGESLGLPGGMGQAGIGMDELGTLQGPRKTPEEIEAEIREEAFEAALQSLMPLRPEEIRKLLEYYDRTQQAVEVPVHPYPRPEVSVINVSLDPGIAPPALRVASGHVTTLNVLDVTGAPWPIHDISWAGNFQIDEPEEGSHVIRIIPLSEFAYGNISVRLLTLKTPITFTLRTHRDVVHYRVDARVPEYGPFANAPLIDAGMSLAAGDPDITSILDGVPPGGAEKLVVSGVDGRTTAYLFNEMTYVRTPLTLLSPAWDQSVSSADGMKVYAMSETPVLLLSDEGRMMRAYLSREEAAGENGDE